MGIDCVAMCVNDIVCHGAKPLIFLDYLATGKLYPETAAQIVKGVAAGCEMAGCALIGGETAEMPGFYQNGEYDMAGFSVGIVKKQDIISGADIKVGDVLVGLASSGIHSNGFSLVRKLVTMDTQTLETKIDSLGESLADALLTPTKIYVQSILKMIKKHHIKGIAHITGGGFIENIPRMLPEGLSAKIEIRSFEKPPIFDFLTAQAEMDIRSAYNTFNMGIGMVIAVSKKAAQNVCDTANRLGEKAYIIGEVVNGGGGVWNFAIDQTGRDGIGRRYQPAGID